MPCLAMHIAIAKKYLEMHPEENKEEFIKGTIAPDISEDKYLAHYGNSVNFTSVTEYLQKKVNLKKYLMNNEIKNSYDRAYFLHLLCDYYWYDDFLKKGIVEEMTAQEFKKTIVADYNRITSYIIEKYKLEIPKEIEKIISHKEYGNLEIINMEQVENLIKKMSNINLEECARQILNGKVQSTEAEQNGDNQFMKEAIKEAKKAYKIKEVPIGAIIVKDGEIISRGFNEKERKNDVTKHAEIIAIQRASKKLNNWRLNDCTMYVTLKPCNMCTGAIAQSRIKRVVIGTLYESKGATESHNVGNCQFDEKTKVTTGVMEKECKEILQNFFKELR